MVSLKLRNAKSWGGGWRKKCTILETIQLKSIKIFIPYNMRNSIREKKYVHGVLKIASLYFSKVLELTTLCSKIETNTFAHLIAIA